MIRKHNLDPSLIAWIMNFTGLGPGIGEIHHLVGEDTAYYSWLKDDMKVHTNYIHHTPMNGYNALTPNRNDCLLVHPETYTMAESLAWAKPQTHMIGVGNPTWRQGGKIRLQTTDTSIVASVDVQASGVFMGGFNISQNGADAACLTGLRLSSTYFSGKQLDVRSFLNSEIAAIEAASCLEFADVASGGFGSTFNDCNFGTMSGAARTATGAACNGVILFAKSTSSGSPGAYAEFHDCRVLSRCEAAGGAMIKVLDARWGIDRLVLFKNSLVANFWLNYTDNLDGAIYCDVATPGSGKILLDKCALAGVDQWQTQDGGNILATMPIVGVGGGIEREPTAATGT